MFRRVVVVGVLWPLKVHSFLDCYDSAMARIETGRGIVPNFSAQLRNVRHASLTLMA
jgi:hypothetical protein